MALALRSRPAGSGPLPDRCASLALMALTSLFTAFSGDISIGSRVRYQVIDAIDGAIGVSLPAFICLGGDHRAGGGGAVDRRPRRATRPRSASSGAACVRSQRADLHEPARRCARSSPSCARRWDCAARVDVRCSTRATVPMVLGWRQPLILLPAGTVSRLTPSQLRAVLAHELAHVRRGDSCREPASRSPPRRCCSIIPAHGGSRDVSAPNASTAATTWRWRSGGMRRPTRARWRRSKTRAASCRLVVAAASGTLLDRIQRIVGPPAADADAGRAASLALLGRVACWRPRFWRSAMSVPPSLPAGAQLRRRVPPPNGVVLPPSEQQRLPRSPVR